MEIWDLYDENRNKTGKDCIRGEEIPEDCYHLVVHIWIKNKKGEFLISQRAEDRKQNPLKWECVGGSILKDEESLQGAIREVKEEVGIDLNENDGTLVLTKVRKQYCGKKYNDILDVWLYEYNGEVDLKNATTKEVNQVKWMNKDEIKKLYDNKELVQTLGYFFEEIDI